MPSLVLDCRWLGRGGTGTVVSLLVRGMADLGRAGEVGSGGDGDGFGEGSRFDTVLWGPADALAPLAWPGAAVVDDRHDPHQWAGQRGGMRRPRGDVFGAMHQIRPFAARNVLQVLHDTIPLQVATSRRVRAAKKAYLLAVARRSALVVTGSEHARQCLHDELGVPLERIGLLHYPVDPDLQDRVAKARARIAPSERRAPQLLYVGRFARHKNVDRLVEAFARTEACRQGARLVLAGGTPDEVTHVRSLAGRLGVDRSVEVTGTLPQDALDARFASSDAVVLPSLAEGFGLPAWEGRCVGLAVCASATTSIPEAAGPDARQFDPTSVDAIADALDDVVVRKAGRGPVPTSPTPAEFAREYGAHVEAVLARSTRSGRTGR